MTPRSRRVIETEPSDAEESNHSENDSNAEIQYTKATGIGSRPRRIKEFVHYQSQGPVTMSWILKICTEIMRGSR